MISKLKVWFHTLLFTPASPIPLAAMRIALSAILLVQSYMILGDFLTLYSPNGFYQGDLRRFLLAPQLPFYLDWDALGAIVGLPAERAIRALFLVYVTGLSFLLIGFHSRVAAVTVWVSHFLLKLNLGYSSSYGVDTFSHIALFYLMFMPMNRVWSMDALMGRVQGDAGVAQRVSLRIFQLHLFLIYFSTGIEKILGWQWRTGEVMWRAWMMPQFQVYDMTWLAWYPWLAKALAWGTLFLEIGYPLLLGIPRTRKLAARGIISLHLGIALTMHLWTFSSVMITLTACAFFVPAEPAPEKRTADLPGRVQADVLVMT